MAATGAEARPKIVCVAQNPCRRDLTMPFDAKTVVSPQYRTTPTENLEAPNGGTTAYTRQNKSLAE